MKKIKILVLTLSLVLGVFAGWVFMLNSDLNGSLVGWNASFSSGDETEQVFADVPELGIWDAEDYDADAVLQLIDELAAHPDDPTKPANIAGVPDEEFGEMHSDDADFLMTDALEVVRSGAGEPRHLFEIGRTALWYGEEQMGIQLLKEAAEAGSAAAAAHLGFIAEDEQVARKWLEQAAQGGFAPAIEALNELESFVQTGATTQTVASAPAQQLPQFRRKDMIQAMETRNFGSIRADRSKNIKYLATLLGALEEPSAWMRTENAAFETEFDPMLSYDLNVLMATDSQYIRDMAGIVGGGLKDALMGFVQARQQNVNRGTIDPFTEMTALNKGLINSTRQFAVIGADAQYDARVMIDLYRSNPDRFRKIYGGIKEFVRGQL